jgi:hypothetical protein
MSGDHQAPHPEKAPQLSIALRSPDFRFAGIGKNE